MDYRSDYKNFGVLRFLRRHNLSKKIVVSMAMSVFGILALPCGDNGPTEVPTHKQAVQSFWHFIPVVCLFLTSSVGAAECLYDTGKLLRYAHSYRNTMITCKGRVVMCLLPLVQASFVVTSEAAGCYGAFAFQRTRQAMKDRTNGHSCDGHWPKYANDSQLALRQEYWALVFLQIGLVGRGISDMVNCFFRIVLFMPVSKKRIQHWVVWALAFTLLFNIAILYCIAFAILSALGDYVPDSSWSPSFILYMTASNPGSQYHSGYRYYLTMTDFKFCH